MDCIFCKIAKGEISTKKIYENDNFFSIFDINPELEGHALVISKNHFSDIFNLPEKFGGDLLDCIKKTALEVMDNVSGEGFNLINNTNEVAGMIIHHFHVHIIPRKKSDNAILKFIDKETKKIVGLK